MNRRQRIALENALARADGVPPDVCHDEVSIGLLLFSRLLTVNK